MVRSHPPGGPGVRETTRGRERPADVFARVFGLVSLQLDVDTPPDDFGDGHAQTPGPPLHPPMLNRFELYLKSHHDGIIMPSLIRPGTMVCAADARG